MTGLQHPGRISHLANIAGFRVRGKGTNSIFVSRTSDISAELSVNEDKVDCLF